MIQRLKPTDALRIVIVIVVECYEFYWILFSCLSISSPASEEEDDESVNDLMPGQAGVHGFLTSALKCQQLERGIMSGPQGFDTATYTHTIKTNKQTNKHITTWGHFSWFPR